MCFPYEKRNKNYQAYPVSVTLAVPNFRPHFRLFLFYFFFLNKISLGKKFICKTERLNVSIDSDETAHYEPSFLDLHCL